MAPRSNFRFPSIDRSGICRTAILCQRGIFLPQDGIVFVSDLLFVGNHPYLAEGNPYKLLDALHKLSRMDAAIYVPDHGPVGSREDLFLEIEYIEHCLAAAQTG